MYYKNEIKDYWYVLLKNYKFTQKFLIQEMLHTIYILLNYNDETTISLSTLWGKIVNEKKNFLKSEEEKYIAQYFRDAMAACAYLHDGESTVSLEGYNADSNTSILFDALIEGGAHVIIDLIEIYFNKQPSTTTTIKVDAQELQEALKIIKEIAYKVR